MVMQAIRSCSGGASALTLVAVKASRCDRVERKRLLRGSLSAALFALGAVAFAAVIAGVDAIPAGEILYVVDSTGDGGNVGNNTLCDDGTGHCTLRAAIEAANSHVGNDGIRFNIPTTGNNCDASDNCTINLPRTLGDLTDSLTITGPGADKLTVKRNSSTQFRIFNVTTTGTVSFSGMTIANGFAPNASNGGGIQNVNAGTVNVTNSTLSGNFADNNGGGIYNNTGPVNITNCTLTGDSANIGGGIYNNTGPVNITNSTLTGDSANDGGGIYNNIGPVNITNCTLSSNSAFEGGGIFNNSAGTVNVSNSTLSSNSASAAAGGGIFNQGTVTISNSTLSGNAAACRTGCLNGVPGLGGGIFNTGGAVTISNTTLSGNSATGAIGSQGFPGGQGSGGAISTTSVRTVNVTNSTISGNSATGGIGVGLPGGGQATGGGIFSGGGTLNVTNSTLSGNSASGGAGLQGGPGGPGSGGGIYTIASSSVKSTIIANNTASTSSPDISGSFTSQGFNLIGKNDGAATSFPAGNPNANNDIVGTGAAPVDPKLDPSGLKDNGGPTKTIALLFGSPAIDKGTSAGLTGNLSTDQRGTGFPRTFDDPATPNATGGDGTDIGAFEVQTVAPTVLANISTRLRVETGDNVLIGGFIVTGTQPKRVIVRAIGPSLSLPGALADPILELHGPGAFATITNDNWRSTQEAEIIATTIQPSNDLESAIVATLPANNSAYTAIVRGVNNGTGIGVVEAYDLDRSVDSKLANISTRGLVQTGDNVMIGGLIVVGQNSLRVIVRAIGPSLPLPGALGDPALELRDINGALIAANDNWRSDQEAEIIATTIPPTNDLESAIVRNLVPGNYTAIVSGVNNTTGVALVEAYGLN
jgi:CSLREA domain-containing protein